MKRLDFDRNWPVSWQTSYGYDLEEVYGATRNHGYVYAYARRRRETFRLIQEVLPPGSRLLDVAAAQGNFSLALAELGYDVTWNDVRAELVDYVRLKQETGKLSFAPGNAFELKPARLFDGVLIAEVIEHVAHPDRFLAKMAELVRPGGYIIMTTPNGAYFRNSYLPRFSDCPAPEAFEAIQFRPDSDGHIFLLHPEEVSRLAHSAGLEVEKLNLTTNLLTHGHVKTGPLLRVLPRSLIDGLEALSVLLPRWLEQRILSQIAVRLRKPGGP